MGINTNIKKKQKNTENQKLIFFDVSYLNRPGFKKRNEVKINHFTLHPVSIFFLRTWYKKKKKRNDILTLVVIYKLQHATLAEIKFFQHYHLNLDPRLLLLSLSS